MTGTETVLLRTAGRIGRITLNRPASLNALDLPMIQTMSKALTSWLSEPQVALVVLDSADDRAFCAGGDITVVRRAALGNRSTAWTFWAEEYRLDAAIARYPKPVVALMDGITMGGGIGIAGHAAVRVVTERSVLAMPEVAIGLAPDVGSALLLTAAPGETGTHLALTATRVGAADAIYCGLADHLVPSSRLPALRSDLAALRGTVTTEQVHKLVTEGYAEPCPRAPLIDSRTWIDYCYRADTVENIRARLQTQVEPAAARAAEAIGTAAPTAAKVTLRSLRTPSAVSGIEECLRQDYRLCRRFLDHPDLAEGIRAAVIDKDRSPRWSPPSLAEVDSATVDQFFASLGADELVL
jgi:enoyl-CoA hydratase